MSKGKKLVEPRVSAGNKSQFYNVETISEEHPRVSITFLEHGGSYGFRHYIKKSGSEANKDFFTFISEFRSCKNISEAITQFSSRNGNKVGGELEDNFRVSLKVCGKNVGSITHLHTKRGGKGKFVLHGFRDGDNFEIVGLDPEHEAH